MLNSSDRKKLRGFAHHLEPSIIIGKHGYNEGVKQSINESLSKYELIKIKFIEHKKEKESSSQSIASDLDAQIIGSIGNIFIFFKQHPDPEKRKISI